MLEGVIWSWVDLFAKHMVDPLIVCLSRIRKVPLLHKLLIWIGIKHLTFERNILQRRHILLFFIILTFIIQFDQRLRFGSWIESEIDASLGSGRRKVDGSRSVLIAEDSCRVWLTPSWGEGVVVGLLVSCWLIVWKWIVMACYGHCRRQLITILPPHYSYLLLIITHPTIIPHNTPLLHNPLRQPSFINTPHSLAHISTTAWIIYMSSYIKRLLGES